MIFVITLIDVIVISKLIKPITISLHHGRSKYKKEIKTTVMQELIVLFRVLH